MGPRIRSFAVVAVVAITAAVAAVAALNGGALPPLDVAFVSILFAFLGLGARAAVLAWRSAHRAASLAAATIVRSPEEAARAAVDEERARMSADIEAVVRRAVLGIRAHAAALPSPLRPPAAGSEGDDTAGSRHDLAAAAPGEPATAGPTTPVSPADVPAVLRAIQHDGRAATAELRRLLELLRAPGGDGGPVPAGAGPVASPRPRPGAPDLVLAAVAVAVCLVESLAGPALDLPGPSVVAVLLGVVAAAATLAWRVDPGAALAVQAAAVAVGVVLGSPIRFGTWTVLAFGLPMWAAVAHPRRGPLVIAGPVALAAIATWSQVAWSPDNVGVLVVILAAAAITGAASRVLDDRRRRSAARAALHEAVLAREADAAVRRDRVATARELHDAVSATIGVIVMQAGAAEVRWASDRPAAIRAIEVLVGAADQAVDELDDLMPRLAGSAIGGSADRGPADLPSLVERMRRAGVDVVATLPEPVPDLPRHLAETAYRVAQEGVANAVRHAQGSRIALRLELVGDTVEVSVVDDGAPVAPRSRAGYGLTGLAERVAGVGGEFAAGPGDERGFRVVARLPLARVGGAPG
ncbi:sensor histidine kinase [Agromyces sp. SYSU T00266]|uniref:sensor histidine kinase n=1 Tax=Agromyces zhanjiangensis TaxID=3158562 RepID=UPI003399946F